MKKLVLLIVAVCLTSCFQLKRYDYSSMESYQIGNASSQDVTLHFYEYGEPKMVYYEIYNQSSPVLKTRGSYKKNAKTLSADSVVTLTPNNTVLFYWKRLNNPEAECLYDCGGQDGILYPFLGLRHFLGDSVTASTSASECIALSVQNGEQWETWYDEKSFIYYHFWRIE